MIAYASTYLSEATPMTIPEMFISRGICVQLKLNAPVFILFFYFRYSPFSRRGSRGGGLWRFQFRTGVTQTCSDRFQALEIVWVMNERNVSFLNISIVSEHRTKPKQKHGRNESNHYTLNGTLNLLFYASAAQSFFRWDRWKSD